MWTNDDNDGRNNFVVDVPNNRVGDRGGDRDWTSAEHLFKESGLRIIII